MTETRCGYVAILGRPNMGKSTLLNALVGQKIAGVSAKPQTTRNRILGINQQGACQILFLDTPGVHRVQKKERLNSLMNREAWSVVNEADLILYLADCVQGWQDGDDEFLRNILKSASSPVLLLLSKSDRKKRVQAEQMAEIIGSRLSEALKGLTDQERARLLSPKPVPVSAKDKDRLKTLLESIVPRLPAGPWLYSADDLTDRSQNFVASELIREKVFRLLGDELPYHSAVRIEKIAWDKDLVRIQADIIVNRMSHKGMVIGKAGSKIKEIGSAARASLEQHFGQKVYLDLEVVVDEGWTDDDSLIAQYSSLDLNN